MKNMVAGVLADHRHGAIQFRDFRTDVTAIEENERLVLEYRSSLGSGEPVHDRGELYENVDFVSLNEFLKKVGAPSAAHGTPHTMSTFLEYWHHRYPGSFPELNVVFMNNDSTGHFQRRSSHGLQ
jgi:hypothetical protein